MRPILFVIYGEREWRDIIIGGMGDVHKLHMQWIQCQMVTIT